MTEATLHVVRLDVLLRVLGGFAESTPLTDNQLKRQRNLEMHNLMANGLGDQDIADRYRIKKKLVAVYRSKWKKGQMQKRMNELKANPFLNPAAKVESSIVHKSIHSIPLPTRAQLMAGR